MPEYVVADQQIEEPHRPFTLHLVEGVSALAVFTDEDLAERFVREKVPSGVRSRFSVPVDFVAYLKVLLDSSDISHVAIDWDGHRPQAMVVPIIDVINQQTRNE